MSVSATDRPSDAGGRDQVPSPASPAGRTTETDAASAGARTASTTTAAADATAATRTTALVVDACRVIEQAIAEGREPSLTELARQAGYSAPHFQRVFKQTTGVSPKHYASQVRAARARRALDEAPTVTDAITDAGYASTGRFYEQSGTMLGMTPTAYRRGAPDETIRFAVGECSLGSVLVAATDRGVCAILLGDDPDELAVELQRRFANALIVGADSAFEQTVAVVVGLIERPASAGEPLPLDIRGTAFQQQVWSALREIPPGETTTYAELATRIGRPTASRAVAQACGANHLAVAIPCHRVIRTGGGLSGYRWGVERKAELLRRERD